MVASLRPCDSHYSEMSEPPVPPHRCPFVALDPNCGAAASADSGELLRVDDFRRCWGGRNSSGHRTLADRTISRVSRAVGAVRFLPFCLRRRTVPPGCASASNRRGLRLIRRLTVGVVCAYAKGPCAGVLAARRRECVCAAFDGSGLGSCRCRRRRPARENGARFCFCGRATHRRALAARRRTADNVVSGRFASGPVRRSTLPLCRRGVVVAEHVLTPAVFESPRTHQNSGSIR